MFVSNNANDFLYRLRSIASIVLSCCIITKLSSKVGYFQKSKVLGAVELISDFDNFWLIKKGVFDVPLQNCHLGKRRK